METTSSSGSEHGISIPTPPSLKSHNTPTIASHDRARPAADEQFLGAVFSSAGMEAFLCRCCVPAFYVGRSHRRFPIRIADGANVTLALI